MAQYIINKSNERVKYINEHNQDLLKGKTIGIIKSTAIDKTKVSSEFMFYSPYVYPMIYASDPTKGIGMSFPEPIDAGFINETHGYKKTGSTIKGDASSTLLNQFKNKFDYLVYCTKDVTYNKGLITKDDVLNSDIKNLLKDSSKASENILFTNQGQWYQSAWGIIGKKVILNEITNFLNLKDMSISNQWVVPSKENQKRLRYHNIGQ